MRLDRIKLAGFKSFVDPTLIPTPGNLIGIVGPNGCGKSNIIDAVRWVMGESSAKHLRGENMADVIFNGSSSRKPVGLASVELFFDNTDGKAPGEFARFQEIAIKRQVTRDGQSTYSLNGTRCRRRDIIDLFLGTGLGSRSYAIIEQGTISRLIEAKPSELRELIEEAAGISRYQERRHETELRMGHTKENLDRLLDLREEVAKQVESLKRQTQKAERYTAFKDQEQTLKRQLLGLRWQNHQATFERLTAECEATEIQSEEAQQLYDLSEQRLEQARSRQETLQKTLHDTQAQFYELGSDISRITQSLKHAKETRDTYLEESGRLRDTEHRAVSDLAQENVALQSIQAESEEIEANRQLQKQQEALCFETHQAKDTQLKAVRKTLENLSQSLTQKKTQWEIESSRLQQLDQQAMTIEKRFVKLNEAQAALEREALDFEIEPLEAEGKALEQQHTDLLAQLTSVKGSLERLRAEIAAEQAERSQHLAQRHGLEGQITSLKTQQSHAMGKDQSALETWLNRHQLADCRRLAEAIDVEPHWEHAVETLLGPWLKALCVKSQAALELALGDLPEAPLALIVDQDPAGPNAAPEDTLRGRVRSDLKLDGLFKSVRCVESLEEARTERHRLAPGEMLMLPDGTRVGDSFLLRSHPSQGEEGVIRRERELKSLRERLDQEIKRLAEKEHTLNDLDQQVRALTEERHQRESDERRISGQLATLRAELNARQSQKAQHERRASQVFEDREDLLREQTSLLTAREAAIASLDGLSAELPHLEQNRNDEDQRRQIAETEVSAAQQALQQCKDHLRALEAKQTQNRAAKTLTERHIERLKTQLSETQQRMTAIEAKVASPDTQHEESEKTLESLRQQRAAVEIRLAEERHQAETLEREIKTALEEKSRLEQQREALRKRLEKVRLALSANAVHRETLEGQLAELGIEAGAVMAHLGDATDEKSLQLELDRLALEITRLGAVNLSAIEEYPEQLERLTFLETQEADLRQSLGALTEAIEKIDQECRTRFRATFDLINAGLGRMFPKLFGGGEASLALTERELLEAGVTIMARPPGKRNSSIHLLSGGEKALTAAALVFAIFELNPAPFCLLDEVDAPLDDANVGRFSQLVKEMSEKVQFLFISHNKATMEIATHLAGVTMKEPGVSRIVAVDLDAAVEMTTA